MNAPIEGTMFKYGDAYVIDLEGTVAEVEAKCGIVVPNDVGLARVLVTIVREPAPPAPRPKCGACYDRGSWIDGDHGQLVTCSCPAGAR